MNIAIIGAGNMGSALTQLLTRAGHNVRITARNRIAPTWIHKAADAEVTT